MLRACVLAKFHPDSIVRSQNRRAVESEFSGPRPRSRKVGRNLKWPSSPSTSCLPSFLIRVLQQVLNFEMARDGDLGSCQLQFSTHGVGVLNLPYFGHLMTALC
ncbi:hypothetical protein VTI74DRAFT_8011 [Chaetomium olivicolor]